uniref:Doublecortin domain-containing protein 2 n=1 Tax=Junco hyemalis TaxID=40217 RepID=A0A8C5JHE8_JUNHY
MASPGTKASWLSQPSVKSVLVYRNGDPFFPGRRIVIHEKKVSNFDVFLKEVTGGVQAPFGAVRNIYTPRGGHRVRQLDELQSGEQYVAGGREAFKKLNYLDIGETKKKPAEVNNEVKPVTHSRITVSARFRKPLQEPYTIFLIANGDLISPAVRLLIPRKTLNHWDHILEMATGKVTLRSGAVHRLYTVDGKLVQNGSDLENGQIYVAVGREKFKKLPYGDLLSKGNGGQSKSTIGSGDQGENSSSPQLPKRKDKKSQNPENSVHTVSLLDFTSFHFIFPIIGEDIYKAREEGSEMWGAIEVQEDEDTLVEVPLDQVVIKFNWHLFTDAGPHGLILYLRHYNMFMGHTDDGMGHSLSQAQLLLSGECRAGDLSCRSSREVQSWAPVVQLTLSAVWRQVG